MKIPWEIIGNEWFNYEHVYKRIVGLVPFGGTIVEVGCWKGASTIFLALEAREKQVSVFCVDTWLGSSEHSNTNEVKERKLFGVFLENMRPVIDDISVLRISSVSASRVFEDGSLDAVFIDADHAHESVRQDILCWLPKVKSGGILAGHDYVSAYGGVIKAVNESVKNIEIIECKNNNKCWFSVK